MSYVDSIFSKYCTFSNRFLLPRWGDGKSTLLKQIRKCLNAQFLQEDAQLLYNVYQLSGESYPFYKKAAENAKIPFNNAVERLASDPYVSNDANKESLEGKIRGATYLSIDIPGAPCVVVSSHFLCVSTM